MHIHVEQYVKCYRTMAVPVKRMKNTIDSPTEIKRNRNSSYKKENCIIKSHLPRIGHGMYALGDDMISLVR